MLLVAASPARAGKDVDGVVNLNTAEIGVLALLPGIGPAKAAQIAAYRKRVRSARWTSWCGSGASAARWCGTCALTSRCRDRRPRPAPSSPPPSFRRRRPVAAAAPSTAAAAAVRASRPAATPEARAPAHAQRLSRAAVIGRASYRGGPAGGAAGAPGGRGGGGM